MNSPAETSTATPGIAHASWPEAIEAIRARAPRIAIWALPFVLVVYLGANDGGYNPIIRGEVGVAVWWIVLLGAAIGLLPRVSPGVAGWAGLGLLASFAVWTGLGIAWSSNAEASATEFARVAIYVGVFALVLSARGPDDMRRLINGVACGIVVIAALAALSRLHPEWFPNDDTAQLIGGTPGRLNYPVGYWNGLAALMAMSVPLLLFIAVEGKSLAGRAFAAAGVPLVCLVAFLTLSRGGAIEIVVALLVLVALAPRRLALLPSIGLVALGSTILIIAASQRDALTNGLDTGLAHQQGDEMLAMVVIVCGGVALVQAAIGLAANHRMGPRVRVSRRTTAFAWAGIVLCALLIAGAAGLPGYLSDRWDDFKSPGSAGTGVERFDSSRGAGRYQAWSSALDAQGTHPVTGIGPGNFESWWAQHRTLPVFIRDAHSLYIETLGELGVIGLLLIGGFVVYVLSLGAWRSVTHNVRTSWPYAAGTASAFAFAAAAGIDWVWELAVLPVAFVVLAGGLVASRSYTPLSKIQNLSARAVLIGLAVAAMIAIAIPLRGAEALSDSRAAAASGDLQGALRDAQHAHDREPYAASPDLQLALVYELMGNYPAAVDHARDATAAASHNWRNWLVLSRLEAEAGNPQGAIDAYARAKSLNPRSPLFGGG